MNVFTRLLLTLTFIASGSIASAGTASDWSGPSEPKREIASESLEDTLRSWDRADYSSNLTEEERVEQEVLEANGPVRPAKHHVAKRTIAKKTVAKKTLAKKHAAKSLAKKNLKRQKISKKVALNAPKRTRR